MEKINSELSPQIKRRELSKEVMLLLLCLLSIVLSLVAVILVINGQGDKSGGDTDQLGDVILELRKRLETVEKISEAIGKKLVPDAEIDIHKLSKREAGDDDSESDTDRLLSQLSLGDLSHLRGPAGRDGRDGRDGRGCDPAECSAAVAESDSSVQIQRILELLSNRSSSIVSTSTTQSSPTSQTQFNQAELLASFNETIAYGILRSIQQTNSKLDQLENDLKGETEGQTGENVRPTSSSLVQGTSGGSTYIRWGRTSCDNSSQLLYAGLAAGQHYTHTGGASNYQCLPQEPEYNEYLAGDQGNWIFGAEYETSNHIFPRTQNQDVPCAACYTQQRSATIMIPAVRTCPDSWTKEYEGYLMSGHDSHKRAYEYVCVDGSPESIPGGHAGIDGALFYFVQGSCSTIGRCPPYIEAAELTCVVCSK